MEYEERQKLKHGLYRIYWNDGLYSLAVIGSLHNGDRWYACSNWTSLRHSQKVPGCCNQHCWDSIDRVELIETRSKEKSNGKEQP